jgi:hypothetical protein
MLVLALKVPVVTVQVVVVWLLKLIGRLAVELAVRVAASC